MMVLKDRLLPELALKVVLSGLLDSAWGGLSRSMIVRFFVYGNYVRIGIGEGNIHQWEIDALKASPIQHEWFKIEGLNMISVPGIKYVPGEKASGMPRELIPVSSTDVWIYVNDIERAIFPAYRCFDLDLGKGRMISIISPRTIVRDYVKTIHPAFPQKRYHGKINNVEINLATIISLFEKGYGIGILRKSGSLKIKNPIECFPLLGKEDIKIILKQLN
jgi:hypothetical protein